MDAALEQILGTRNRFEVTHFIDASARVCKLWRSAGSGDPGKPGFHQVALVDWDSRRAINAES
jgi:hypothetical protein